ncbi:MAG: DoxX family protein [Pseudoxanthomonas sp.]
MNTATLSPLPTATASALTSTAASAPLAAAGRLLLAPLFLSSGIAKLLAPAATIAYISSAGAPLPEAAYAAALVVEVGIGLAFLLGLQTRAAAAVLALFSVATALLFHGGDDQNQAIHFWKNLAIAGGLLSFVAFGGGAWSVDALRERARRQREELENALS